MELTVCEETDRDDMELTVCEETDRRHGVDSM